jgi:hypothetical protein
MDIKEIKSWQVRLEKSFENMSARNNELWTKRDEKLEKFMTELREWYTTKKEHEEVRSQLEKFKDKIWSINLYILLAVIWWALALIVK